MMFSVVKKLLAPIAFLAVLGYAAAPSSISIDEGSGVQTVSTTEAQSGNGWSWDPSSRVLKLNQFHGSYIGAIGGDTLVIQLSGVNTITIPDGTSYTLNGIKGNGELIIKDDGVVGRDSLWIGSRSYNGSAREISLIGGSCTFVDVGIAMELVPVEDFSRVPQVGGVRNSYVDVMGSASLNIDMSKMKSAAVGVQGLTGKTSGNITIKAGGSGFAASEINMSGSGKTLLSSPEGYALSSILKIEDTAGEVEFEGNVQLNAGSFNRTFTLGKSKRCYTFEGDDCGFASAGTNFNLNLVDERNNVVSHSKIVTVENNPLTFMYNPLYDIPQLTVGTSWAGTGFLKGLVMGGNGSYTFSADASKPLPSGLTIGNYIYGTPKVETPAGKAGICVTDSKKAKACIEINYAGVKAPPKSITVGGQKGDVTADLAGTGWSYSAARKELTLNGYNSSEIAWEPSEDTLNIVLHGVNKINLPSSVSKRKGIAAKYVRVKADAASGRDSLWIGESAFSQNADSLFGVTGDLFLENVGFEVSLTPASGKTVGINKGFYGVKGLVRVDGNSSFNLDFSKISSCSYGNGLDVLDGKSTGDISIKLPGCAVALTEMRFTGSGKTFISVDGENGVAMKNGIFVVNGTPGDIEIKGKVSLYSSLASKSSFSTGRNMYTAEGKRCAFVAPANSQTLPLQDEDGNEVTHFVVTEPHAGDGNLYVLNKSSFLPEVYNIPAMTVGDQYISGTLRFLVSGASSYKYSVDPNRPLPKGLSIIDHVIRGTVQAPVSAGVAFIHITDNKNSQNRKIVYLRYGAVTVANPVKTITLDKTNVDIAEKETLTIGASVTSVNGGEPSIATISWTSSNTNVAAVSQTGLVTGVAPGQAVISASATDGSGVKTTTTVTVKEALTRVALSDNRLNFVGLVPSAKYLIDNVEYTADESGYIGVEYKWYGKTVTFVKVNANSAYNSNPLEFSVAEPPSYTVSYDMQNHGTQIASQKFVMGTVIEAPDVPTETGYTFVGWYKDVELNTAWNFESDKIESPMTLYAKWAPITYSIRFNGNAPQGLSGSMENQNVVYNERVSLVKNSFARTGYSFDSWNTAADGSGKKYADEASVLNFASVEGAVVDLYAIWTANEVSVTKPMEACFDADEKCVVFGDLLGEGNVLKYDGEYQFSLAIAENYTVTKNFVVKVNGNAVEGRQDEFGKYWFTYGPVDGDLVITVEGVVRLWTVSFVGEYLNGVTRTQIPDQIVENGGKIVLRETPVRAGYTAMGWCKDEACSSEWNVLEDVVTSNITLYPKWNANIYTIVFDANGGSGTMENQRIAYGVRQYLSKNEFVREGYGFEGWASSKTGTKKFDNGASVSVANLPSPNSKSEIYLYAVWKPGVKTVSVLDRTGIVFTGDATVEYDSKYDFKIRIANSYVATTDFGVYVNDEPLNCKKSLGVYECSVERVTSDLVISLTGVLPTWTVSFGNLQGNEIANMTGIVDGSLVTEPSGPFVFVGHTFAGWCKDADCKQAWNFAEDVVVGNTTIYMNWQKNHYNVVFNANAASGVTGTMSPQNITYGQSVTLSENQFVRYGYNFAGWSDYADGSVVYENGSPVKNLSFENNANVDLYAVWSKKSISVMGLGEKVGYSVSGATSVNFDETYSFDVVAENGYDFYTDEPGKYVVKVNGVDVESYRVPSSDAKKSYRNIPVESENFEISVEGVRKVWTVSFNVVDQTIPSVVVFDGLQLPTISNPARNGYDFQGWKKGSNNGPAWNLESDAVHENMTLYSTWSPHIYKISYELFGGIKSSQSPLTWSVSNPAILVSPKKPGYDFCGWFLEESYETQVTTIESEPYRDVTVYAKWSPTVYSVTYHLDDESRNADENLESYTILTPVLKLQPASKPHYHFVGWFSDKDLTKEVTEIAGGATVDVNLYPKFEVDVFTLTFYDVLADRVEKTIQVAYGNTASLAASLTAEGYQFLGWCTDKNNCSETEWNPESPIVADLTVYAYWKKNVYTVHYELNGGNLSGSEEMADISVEHGSLLEEQVASRTGYVWNGWFMDADFKESWNFERETVLNNVTLYAKFTPIAYTVAFHRGDYPSEQIVEQYFTYDKERNLNAASLFRLGYDVVGWDTDVSATKVVYEEHASVVNLTNVANDVINLYAVWTPGTIEVMKPHVMQGYSIIGESTAKVEGNYSFEVKVSKGFVVDATGLVVSVNNVVLDAYENTDEVYKYKVENVAPSLSIKVSGVSPIKYAVNYHLEDDALNSEENITSYDITMSSFSLAMPSREGYEFTGWYSGENADAKKMTKIAGGMEGDIDLYARWIRTGYGAITIAADRSKAVIDGDISAADVAIEDRIEVGSIEFNRTFESGVPATVVLPFALPEGASVNAKFYTLSAVKQVGMGWKATMEQISGLPEANKPYAVILDDDAENGELRFTLNGEKAVVGTSEIENKMSDDNNWIFVGSYKFKEWTVGDEEIGLAYGFAGSNEDGIAAGQFGKVAEGAYITPMRSYLRKADAGVQLIRRAPAYPGSNRKSSLVSDHELPEVIEVCFTSENGSELVLTGSFNTRTGEIVLDKDERWYDLMGRKLEGKPSAKGTYYMNGRKVIVK